jgi:hypothetical protein
MADMQERDRDTFLKAKNDQRFQSEISQQTLNDVISKVH